MARVAIIIGVLLFGLGLGGYHSTDHGRWISLISAALGVGLLGCGVAGLREAARQHAMHAATLLAMLGFVLTLYGLIQLIGKVVQEPQLVTQSMTAVFCGVFVVLAAKSFVDARRRRAATPPPRLK